MKSMAHGFAAFVVLSVGACLLRADLSTVKAEPDLEKRSRAALAYADKTMDAAREAYRAGDWAKVESDLEATRQGVELAFDSLRQSGKDPSRGSKYFKNAEIRTRELTRRIENFRQQVSFDEQAPVEKLKAYVQKVHDDILNGIMGKKGVWGGR